MRNARALFGKDRICAVVAAPSAQEMARQLRRALRETRTVELRLDWLSGHGELMRFLRMIRPARPSATFMATFRRQPAGGRFRGGLADQIAVLQLAAACGCAWCDLEIETAERLAPGSLRKLFGRARLLISWHNFHRTPANLRRVARRLERAGGHAIKLAAQSRAVGDAARLLGLARKRRNAVLVPMGEAALPARVLALRAGSALAYAAAGEKTAPGQLTLEEMKHLYRADHLDRGTRVYGVVGNPVAHSLSPAMHNAGFQARRVNAVYLPFLVRDLKDFLAAVEPLGVRGFSVTLPHKESLLRRLDDCDPLAVRIGAVNTVVVRGGGKLYGYNTDYVGVLRALERRVALRGSRVLILGAGGAARAVAFAMSEAGAMVAVCARRHVPAQKLARAVGGEVIERRSVRREFFDAIVNATPVGMHPHSAASPLGAAELNCRLVFDLIYRPRQTRLLQLAARRGIDTVSGGEMFIAQGTAQWEIWMGERAPVAAMRRAVVQALKAEER